MGLLLAHQEVREKEGPRDRIGEKARMSCCYPLPPGCKPPGSPQSLGGNKRFVLGRSKGVGHALERASTASLS